MNELEKTLGKYRLFQRENRREMKFNNLEKSISEAIYYLINNKIVDYCYLTFTTDTILIHRYEPEAVINTLPLKEKYQAEEIECYLESLERLESIKEYIIIDSKNLKINLLR